MRLGTWPWHIAGSRSDELLACPPVANWTHGGGRQGGRGRQAQGAREARHSAGDQGQGSRNYFTWFETRPPAKGPKKDPCTRSSFRRAFSSAGQKRDRERAGMPALLLTAASWHRMCMAEDRDIASLESTRCRTTGRPCLRKE